MQDYYRLLRNVKNNDEISDNDLRNFKSKKEYRMRNIQPTDYLYHDYYYNYMQMYKRMTIHDDLVNFSELDQLHGSPWRRKDAQRVIGYQKRYGPENAQPVFDESLLNEIGYRSKSMIYGRKK